MPTVEQAVAWLLTLPPGALFATAFGLAVIENVFPPTPSDVLIGLCAFVAAAGGTSVSALYGVVIFGTTLGAAAMYAVGRRYGADGLHKKMEARGWLRHEERVEAAYQRYGLVALFVGRLIAGVRAVVPLMAGALRINAALSIGVMAIASAIWYGVIVWLGSRVGANWEQYIEQLAVFTRWGTGVSIAIVVLFIVAIVIFVRRRRKR